MSHELAATQPTDQGPLRAVLPVLACLLAMWVAHQGSLLPSDPQHFILPLLAIGEALPVLVAVALGALGWGYVVRRLLLPADLRVGPVQLAMGLAVMWMLAWLMASLGLLNMATAWGLCGAGAMLIIWQLAQTQHSHLRNNARWPRVPWTASLAALPAGLLLIAATSPPSSLWPTEAFGYDVMSYHLQLPAEWLANGRMTGLDHNAYSFLPNLVEVGYLQLAAMKGSLYSAIIASQLLHACTALLASWIVAHWLGTRISPTLATLAAGAMLALPWVLITGSMAYNEMAMLAFAAAAVALTFSPAGATLRGAAAIGLLCGAATLAKLPAGPGIAVPVGLILLLRLNASGEELISARKAVLTAVVAGVVGFATLAPWMIRNAAVTGNPVFPNATQSLGAGHWTTSESARWTAGHGPEGGVGHRLGQLTERWLLNPGFGAWPIATGGDEGNASDIARFSARFGLPLFHLIALAGLIAAMKQRDHRRLASAMLLVLAVQVGFWLVATHMQSRFMLAAVLPAAVGVALALDAIMGRAIAGRPNSDTHATRTRIAHLAGTLLTLVLFVQCVRTLAESTLPDGNGGHFPLYASAGTLPSEEDRPYFGPETLVWGNHPLNHLSEGDRVLLVGDANRLIFITTPKLYNTAFDRSPLADLMAEHPDDPAAVADALREAGITHVWVNYHELSRLAGTYGLPDALQPDTLERFAATWPQQYSIAGGGPRNVVTLYALPPRRPAPGPAAGDE